jgi:hypothetical protein
MTIASLNGVVEFLEVLLTSAATSLAILRSRGSRRFMKHSHVEVSK